MNLLFIFDWIILLPITLLRLLLIYFNGAKYNISYLKFLDVMMHADNKYFNQQNDEPSIDTLTDDVRKVIKYTSQLPETDETPKNSTVDISQNEKLKQYTELMAQIESSDSDDEQEEKNIGGEMKEIENTLPPEKSIDNNKKLSILIKNAVNDLINSVGST